MVAKKKVEKKATGINKEYTASPELQAFLKKKTISRGALMKAIWDYVKKNNLQDAKDKRTINPDATLATILGKKPIGMFKIAGKLSPHLS